MNNKEILVIFGGGILVDKEGKWHTDSDEALDIFGKTSNSRWRVEAAKYLFNDAHKQIIVASGLKGVYRDLSNFPVISSVIKSELVELGIPSESIIEERHSGNTLEQLKEIAKIINSYKPTTISIISNEWHLPRISAFMRKDRKLSVVFKSANLISAEDVLIKYDSQKWLKRIETDRNSEIYKDRKSLEKRGVQDIENEVYKGVDYIKT